MYQLSPHFSFLTPTKLVTPQLRQYISFHIHFSFTMSGVEGGSPVGDLVAPGLLPPPELEDPELARRLVAEGGMVLCFRVPVGSRIGIDSASYVVGPRFKGFKAVPRGPHFLSFALPEKSEIAEFSLSPDASRRASVLPSPFPAETPRQGVWVWVGSGDVRVLEWEEREEDFMLDDEMDVEQLERIRAACKRGEFDGAMGMYPLQLASRWHHLTSHISPLLLSHRNPTPRRNVSITERRRRRERSTDMKGAKSGAEEGKCSEDELEYEEEEGVGERGDGVVVEKMEEEGEEEEEDIGEGGDGVSEEEVTTSTILGPTAYALLQRKRKERTELDEKERSDDDGEDGGRSTTVLSPSSSSSSSSSASSSAASCSQDPSRDTLVPVPSYSVLQLGCGQELRVRVVPGSGIGDGGEEGEMRHVAQDVTTFGVDPTPLLERVWNEVWKHEVGEEVGGEGGGLVGDLQLSFLTFYYGHNEQALHHWKHLVHAICTSHSLLITPPPSPPPSLHHTLAPAFITIAAQLKTIPADLFQDLARWEREGKGSVKEKGGEEGEEEGEGEEDDEEEGVWKRDGGVDLKDGKVVRQSKRDEYFLSIALSSIAKIVGGFGDRMAPHVRTLSLQLLQFADERFHWSLVSLVQSTREARMRDSHLLRHPTSLGEGEGEGEGEEGGDVEGGKDGAGLEWGGEEVEEDVAGSRGGEVVAMTVADALRLRRERGNAAGPITIATIAPVPSPTSKPHAPTTPTPPTHPSSRLRPSPQEVARIMAQLRLQGDLEDGDDPPAIA